MRFKGCILKESSNAKSERVLLEWTLRLCLRLVRYDMRLVNNFIIAMYGIMNYLMLLPTLVAFYAKLNEIQSTLVISTPIISNIRLSRREIWSLFSNRTLKSGYKILWIRGENAPQESNFSPFPQYFQYIFLTKGVKLHSHM